MVVIKFHMVSVIPILNKTEEKRQPVPTNPIPKYQSSKCWASIFFVYQKKLMRWLLVWFPDEIRHIHPHGIGDLGIFIVPVNAGWYLEFGCFGTYPGGKELLFDREVGFFAADRTGRVDKCEQVTFIGRRVSFISRLLNLSRGNGVRSLPFRWTGFLIGRWSNYGMWEKSIAELLYVEKPISFLIFGHHITVIYRYAPCEHVSNSSGFCCFQRRNN